MRSLLLLFGAFACSVNAQTLTWRNMGPLLGFENSNAGQQPTGWYGSTATADAGVAHSGRMAARITRTASSAGTFSTLYVSIPMDLTGKKISWRGYIKTDSVSNYAGLWMREDGDGPTTLAFAGMDTAGLKGTTDWQEYTISVPVVSDAKTVYLGFLISGTGTMWVDDLQLLLDERVIAQTGPPRPIDSDHEFDSGSGITLTTLSPAEIRNLATLAKVWGFLKYHHPEVTAGNRHWDYDLFRILPAVLKAPDIDSAASVLSEWVDSIGGVPACAPCAALPEEGLYLRPDLDWILDESMLGSALSGKLQWIYLNRTAADRTFYVSLLGNVQNPQFDHELEYASIRFPDAGYQLLSLFRFWNMVQYFYPDRDIMSDDPANEPAYWQKVLEESIAPIALAGGRTMFQQELFKFIAKIHDTHANLWSSMSSLPPSGDCQLPVRVRFIEGRAMIVSYLSSVAQQTSGLAIGDIIEKIDSTSVEDLVAQRLPYYAASNSPTRMRDMARYLTRGGCGAMTVEVNRGTGTVRVISARVPTGTLSGSYYDDLPGDPFQKLAEDIGYIKISTARSADVGKYLQSAAGTKGLIIDLRNYPSDFPGFTIGGHLVTSSTQFARFTTGDPSNPGAILWRGREGDPITPIAPLYTGKVVVLVNEITQSSAEYHAMLFRATGATIIGSTTAGADGNVSTIVLPGAMSSYFSGIGVYYPDKRPTQRIGIVPDIEVRPTIEGMRAGRDELVDAAMKVIRAE